MRSGIPCAIGFNGFLRALLGDRALLSPSPARCASIVANLTSASRCQDHTTSPSKICALVCRTKPRPSHPAPNVRDDRDTPLLWARDGQACKDDLPVGARGNIFGERNGQRRARSRSDLPVGQSVRHFRKAPTEIHRRWKLRSARVAKVLLAGVFKCVFFGPL
jgi:hypothetical protein